MRRRTAMALLFSLTLAAAPGANAGLLCQADHHCCCTHHDAASSVSPCRMNCSDQSAAERLSAVSSITTAVRLRPIAKVIHTTHHAIAAAWIPGNRLPYLHRPSHSPPKRYLTACTLRL